MWHLIISVLRLKLCISHLYWLCYMRPPISSSWKYSGNMRWHEMAHDEIWWAGFLASSTDSSGSNIGVVNVVFFFYKQLSVPVSTAHAAPCSLYVHCPLSLIQFLCPLPTQSRAVSMSTAHSISCCLFVHYPLCLVLSLYPLSAQSRAVYMSTADSLLCCFFVYCSLGLVLFLYRPSHHV
jgi:hypothetical protein